MNEERINLLCDKLLKGTITVNERQELETWYDKVGEDELEIASGVDKNVFSENLFNRIALKSGLKVTTRRLRTRYAAIAASLIIAFSIAGYFLLNIRDHHTPSSSVQTLSKVMPGGDKAVLKLSDGSVVDLGAVQHGQLATGNREAISKTSDGQIVYKSNPANKQLSGYNTLTTPSGGKFNIQLPDGTLAMLDAQSSITYPAQFSSKERMVTITGQVYLEVVHDGSHPFIVNAGRQVVKDIGTQFNISAYPDDKLVKTTLAEGAVSITLMGKTVTLKPGQTAVTDRVSEKITTENADLEETLAWKNGYFRFNNERIESIMPKIARWYNVDVTYHGKLPTDGFNGTISRSKNIDKVLNMLQRTGIIHFKIEGRSITVLP